VNTCEELLLAEMVFDNVLDPLTPPEIAGLLSALICQVRHQTHFLKRISCAMDF
jgi:superfamily II RNA helicase